MCGDSQRCKVVRQLVYASNDILLDELIRPDGRAEHGSAHVGLGMGPWRREGRCLIVVLQVGSRGLASLTRSM